MWINIYGTILQVILKFSITFNLTKKIYMDKNLLYLYKIKCEQSNFVYYLIRK